MDAAFEVREKDWEEEQRQSTVADESYDWEYHHWLIGVGMDPDDWKKEFKEYKKHE